MAPYSARNPIPNIQKLGEDLAKRLDLQRINPANLTGDAAAQYHAKKAATRRKVIDPTTKSEVVIQDVDASFEETIKRPLTTIPLASVDPKVPPHPDTVAGAPAPYLAEGSAGQYKETLDDLAPPEANPEKTKEFHRRSKKNTVVYHPLPAADLKKSFAKLESTITRATLAIVVGILVLNFIFVGGRVKGVVASLFAGLVVSVGIHLLLRRIQEDSNNINWDSEKQRAKAATESLVPESVEWMNNLVGTVWNLINPELFASVADTLEDVMQASVPPSVVENVRVASIGQGDHPLQILSLRALPDAESGNEKFGDDDPKSRERKRKDRELEGEDDQNMKYYNLEASFAYRAVAAKGVVGKAKNIHLEIVFYLGVKGLFGVPLPIFAELKEIIGTVRLRFQLTPKAPFIKNMTFTFMGLPKIDVSAIPFTSKGLNVLDLPLISNFVNSSVAAALDEYVAPKSLIMDLSKLVQGDDVKKETEAIGLLYIKIHDAVDISGMDRSGKSDAYITLAYSQFGKPMYCTRVILANTNPSWEENTCLPVHPEELKAGEKLSVQLWDSDRLSKDDMVGRVEFDLRDLILNHAGQMTSRSDSLIGEKDGSVMPGELNWEIGYYPRAEFEPSMKTSGENLSLPKEIRSREELQDPVGAIDNAQEHAAVTTPPDPTLPTGIVSIVIHQIENLEIERPRGTFGDYKDYAPAQVTGENTDEEGSHLPSSYCTVLVNDELVFKTRTKVVSSAPIFNAETERFVRDWRNTVITVSCRDEVRRQHDPIIGVVVLKLSDILQTSSQVTSVYPLDGGLGYGRIRLSVLFRSVELKLPRNLLGWDVGSIELLNNEITASDEGGQLTSARLIIDTDVGHGRIRRSWAKAVENGTSWSLQGKRLLLPVRHRYSSAMKVEFHSRGSRKPFAWAVSWLSDIPDNIETTFNLPIWKTDDEQEITQNYITDFTRRKVEAQRIGTLHIHGRFKIGLDESHKQYLETNDDRETYESWETSRAEGHRSRMVKRETGDAVKKLVREGAITHNDVSDDESDDVQPDKPAARPSGLLPQREFEQVDSPSDGFATGFANQVTKYATPNDEPKELYSDDPEELQEPEDMSDSDLESEQVRKRKKKLEKEAMKQQMHRKHRGIMHIKAVRNLKFFKDEMAVGVSKIKSKMSLNGRQPQVETEIE